MSIDYSQLRDTYFELLTDVEAAKALAGTHADNFVKRTYIRALFAMIEGMIFQLKVICLQAHDARPLFKPAEVALLREESATLNDKGEVVTHPAKLKLLDNLIFSLCSYARAHDMQFELEKGKCCGRAALVKASKIRNRITHPKTTAELIVSDKELMEVGQASSWFRDRVVQLLEKTTDASKQ